MRDGNSSGNKSYFVKKTPYRGTRRRDLISKCRSHLKNSVRDEDHKIIQQLKTQRFTVQYLGEVAGARVGLARIAWGAHKMSWKNHSTHLDQK